MRQSKRSFVEKIDFRTSAGNLGGAEASERIRREQGWLGRGPSVVVTDLGIWHFDANGEMRLDSLHPGATLDDVEGRDGLGGQRCASACGDAPADPRRAAPDPRRARSRGRVHPLTNRETRPRGGRVSLGGNGLGEPSPSVGQAGMGAGLRARLGATSVWVCVAQTRPRPEMRAKMPMPANRPAIPRPS